MEDTTDVMGDATDKDEKEKHDVSSQIGVKKFYKKDEKHDVTSSDDMEIIEIKHDIKKVIELKVNTSEEEKQSPDFCVVNFNQKTCRIKDTVHEERQRTRSGYQCALARQLKNTSYHHPKNVNVRLWTECSLTYNIHPVHLK